MKQRAKSLICLGLALLLSLASAAAESGVTVTIIHGSGEVCTPEEEAAQSGAGDASADEADASADAALSEEAASEAGNAQAASDDASAQAETLAASTAEPITPSQGSPYPCTHEDCYWSTPMDITDEERVWRMLMSPITVIDVGQKEQIQLRSEPSEQAEAVADVTGYSQGVHVLETLDNGWTLVEVYSSSFHDSEVKAWNRFTQGYVKTDLLKVKEVGNKEYAMVMDKLTQRVYIFKDGKLFTELLASTGLVNERQPYNETRSGEFLLVSPVGQFRSDNLLCNYGIRFNFGDLIHEVPHVQNADGTANYSTCEKQLGERASHGCIRIQRLTNGEGVNMRRIWNELYKSIAKRNVKFVIWEDLQGRQLPIPSPDTVLYYNADGGTNYHIAAECNGVRAKYLPLAAFSYGELDTGDYASLTACAYCAPPKRLAEIEAKNALYR